MVYVFLIQTLQGAAEQSNKDIIDGLPALICDFWDSSYKNCWIAELGNSKHDLLSLHDTSHIVEFLSLFLRAPHMSTLFSLCCS